MSDTNLLKLFAGNVIIQSEMEKEVKRQFLNFVEDASEHQVKAFLMDGVMIPEPDDLIICEIINDRFSVSNIPGIIEENEEVLTTLSEGPVGSVAGMVIFSPVAWAAWRTASALLSKKRRYCGAFRISTERDKCLDKYKIMQAQKVLSTLRTDLDFCPKTDDPEKCKTTKQKGITKYDQKVKLLTRKFRDRWEAGSSAI